MVGFQEVVETWGVYWFGRRLGRGWWEDLFCEVEKGRLKISDDLVCAKTITNPISIYHIKRLASYKPLPA